MAWLNIFSFVTVVLGLCCLCNAKHQVCIISESDHRQYDDTNEICCNNVVQWRVRDQACCEDTIYFNNVQLCCGGKVMDRFIPPKGGKVERDCFANRTLCREQICCNDELHDKESTKCCQNKPISLTTYMESGDKSAFKCCGDKVINMHSHFCCNNTEYSINSVIRCCGERTYDVHVERCLDNYHPLRVVDKYIDFCGNITYNRRTHSCCETTLNSIPELAPDWKKRNPNLGCCDQYGYDNSKEHCCREVYFPGFKSHIIPLKENIHCCGNGVYNESHQVCPNGEILEKVAGKELCGKSYIDGSSEKCCGEIKPYNVNSHECCMGEEDNVIPKNEKCCNGIGINDNKLCCAEIKPCEKNNITDNECCYSHRTESGKTYNSINNDFCVDGEVIRFPPGTKPCTRYYFYYPETQICCVNRVENISSGYDQCCNDKPYNSKSQQCCNNEVSNISPSEGRCCEDLKVYRFNDSNNPCIQPCRDTTYDYTNEVCCDGKVYPSKENTECCGTFHINSSTTECCGERFPLSKTDKMKCCGNRDLYDVRFSKCVNEEKIIPLVQGNQSDVQRLCSPMALKHFERGVQYACESQYAVTGRIVGVQITGKHGHNIKIKMLLSDVRNLNRGENFITFSGQQNIHFTIMVAKSDGVVCKQRFLDRYCEVFVFFNAKVKNGHVKIRATSKFFMAHYTRKWEKLVTNQLSHQFCQDKFSVHNDQ